MKEVVNETTRRVSIGLLKEDEEGGRKKERKKEMTSQDECGMLFRHGADI
jgi:hypothetical protein